MIIGAYYVDHDYLKDGTCWAAFPDWQSAKRYIRYVHAHGIGLSCGRLRWTSAGLSRKRLRR